MCPKAHGIKSIHIIAVGDLPRPERSLCFDDYHRLNDNRFGGYILVTLATRCTNAAYFVQNLGALSDFAEYGVAPALHAFAAVIEKIVVLNVDKELGGSGMRVRGAGHGDGAKVILQAIVCFVLDWLTRDFLLHVRIETTALYHEVVNNPVKDGAIVVATPRIAEKIGDGFGRFISIQFEFDFAECCANDDHGFFLGDMCI